MILKLLHGYCAKSKALKQVSGELSVLQSQYQSLLSETIELRQ